MNDFIKNKQLWVPERPIGVCIWITKEGLPLSDGDGVLSAEGFMYDKNIEKKVAEAALYWTGSSEGKVSWVAGARKISASEREDQQDRLNNGLTPDPYEDVLDQYFDRR